MKNTNQKHKIIIHETKEEVKAEEHHFTGQKELKEEIAKKAYELYESRGCVANRDLDDWLEAERLIKAGCDTSH